MQSLSSADYDSSTAQYAEKGTCSSRSRSTSPGSSLNLVEADEGIQHTSYIVRNTFIDFKEDEYTEGRLHERDILSCPASRIGMMRLAVPSGFECFETVGEAEAASLATLATPSVQQLAVGPLEMPTVGSSEHANGTCQPCAFFYKQGCENGVQCKFCHLCAPGEKRRRQKEKKTMIRQRIQEHPSEQVSTDVLPYVEVPCGRPSFSSCGGLLANVPYGIKNTFIETSGDLGMPPLERAILSCPASKVGCMRLPMPLALDLLDSDDLANAPLATPQLWPVTPLDYWPATPVDSVGGPMIESLVYQDSLALAATMFSMPAMAPPMEHAPWLWQPMVPPPPPAGCPPSTFQSSESVESALATKSASVLRLADTIPEVELGIAEVPTVGSMNHHLGTCRPCAFLYKQGCGNGVQCPFCHLCDSGEKKRRQNLKKAQLQSMRQEFGTTLPTSAALG